MAVAKRSREVTRLDDLVQLHERISIIYVVDGYSAELITETDDGDLIIREVVSDTVENALAALELALSGLTLEDIRSRRTK
jgi:hypothetical protein